MGVEDQAGDLVVLVRDDGLVEELPQRHIGECEPRCDHLLGAVGRDPGKPVARARRARLGEKVTQIVEHVRGGVDDVAKGHGGSEPRRGIKASAYHFPMAPITCVGWPLEYRRYALRSQGNAKFSRRETGHIIISYWN
jgi:hypothetical protein